MTQGHLRKRNSGVYLKAQVNSDIGFHSEDGDPRSAQKASVGLVELLVMKGSSGKGEILAERVDSRHTMVSALLTSKK